MDTVNIMRRLVDPECPSCTCDTRTEEYFVETAARVCGMSVEEAWCKWNQGDNLGTFVMGTANKALVYLAP